MNCSPVRRVTSARRTSWRSSSYCGKSCALTENKKFMPSSTLISATYRMQFNKDFTLQAATNLLDYLFDLGMTHVYASPIFRSRPGSAHGYDVIDPTRLNPEIGSEAD